MNSNPLKILMQPKKKVVEIRLARTKILGLDVNQLRGKKTNLLISKSLEILIYKTQVI